MSTETTEFSTADLHGEVVAHEFVDSAVRELPYHDIKAALAKAGLDENAMKDMSPFSAFSRACKSLKEGRIIKKLEREGTTIRFQFTEEYLAGGHYNYKFEAELALDTETGDVTCDENPDLAETAEKLIASEMGVRTIYDVSRLIKNLMQGNADLMPITRKGGAYFVPVQHKEFVDRIETFLDACGGRIVRFPVPKGTPKGDAAVCHAVSTELDSMTGELLSVMDGWDETTRPSSFRNMKKRFDTLAAKAELYGYMFEDAKGRVDAAISAAQQRFQERCVELSGETRNEQPPECSVVNTAKEDYAGTGPECDSEGSGPVLQGVSGNIQQAEDSSSAEDRYLENDA